jgi:hypothetical protein
MPRRLIMSMAVQNRNRKRREHHELHRELQPCFFFPVLACGVPWFRAFGSCK